MTRPLLELCISAGRTESGMADSLGVHPLGCGVGAGGIDFKYPGVSSDWLGYFPDQSVLYNSIAVPIFEPGITLLEERAAFALAAPATLVR